MQNHTIACTFGQGWADSSASLCRDRAWGAVLLQESAAFSPSCCAIPGHCAKRECFRSWTARGQNLKYTFVGCWGCLVLFVTELQWQYTSLLFLCKSPDLNSVGKYFAENKVMLICNFTCLLHCHRDISYSSWWFLNWFLIFEGDSITGHSVFGCPAVQP